MGYHMPYNSLATYTSTARSDIELIRAGRFCQDLSAEVADQLYCAGEVRTYRKGEVVFRQGQPPREIHFLLQGKVCFTTTRESGEAVVVELIPAGNFFLTNSVVLNMPYLLGAEAASNLRLLVVPAENFLQLMGRHPALNQLALKQLAGQTRVLLNQISQLKLLSANERLAHYILCRLDRQEGAIITELEDERRVIAQRLGMTPESLSRSIAALRPIGVTFEQRTVRVADAGKLRQFCGLDVSH